MHHPDWIKAKLVIMHDEEIAKINTDIKKRQEQALLMYRLMSEPEPPQTGAPTEKKKETVGAKSAKGRKKRNGIHPFLGATNLRNKFISKRDTTAAQFRGSTSNMNLNDMQEAIDAVAHSGNLSKWSNRASTHKECRISNFPPQKGTTLYYQLQQ